MEKKEPMTTTKIARWESKGGKWTAELVRHEEHGYRLEEFKNGNSIGASFRPLTFFAGDSPMDEIAIEYFDIRVKGGFDVFMYRRNV
jgi:hypothetical protein